MPLGLDAEQFGHWVGASVHDVGQVVATAQTAGAASLAVAAVVKLTRVVLLAPLVAAIAVQFRRRSNASMSAGAAAEGDARKTALVPLFVVGFVAAILIRSVVLLPDGTLEVARVAQTALLAVALFGLGTAINVRRLVTTDWRVMVVGLLAWVLVAVVALLAVRLG